MAPQHVGQISAAQFSDLFVLGRPVCWSDTGRGVPAATTETRTGTGTVSVGVIRILVVIVPCSVLFLSSIFLGFHFVVGHGPGVHAIGICGCSETKF